MEELKDQAQGQQLLQRAQDTLDKAQAELKEAINMAKNPELREKLTQISRVMHDMQM